MNKLGPPELHHDRALNRPPTRLALGPVARLDDTEDARHPDLRLRVRVTNVGARVGGPHVAYLEQPRVVRLDDGDPVVRGDSLSAGRQDGAQVVGGGRRQLGRRDGLRGLLPGVVGGAAGGGCRRPVGIVREAPDYRIVLEILRDARDERVLPNHGDNRLITGGAH